MTKVAQLVIPWNVISHWNTHCLVVDQLRESRLSNGSGLLPRDPVHCLRSAAWRAFVRILYSIYACAAHWNFRGDIFVVGGCVPLGDEVGELEDVLTNFLCVVICTGLSVLLD